MGTGGGTKGWKTTGESDTLKSNCLRSGSGTKFYDFIPIFRDRIQTIVEISKCAILRSGGG